MRIFSIVMCLVLLGSTALSANQKSVGRQPVRTVFRERVRNYALYYGRGLIADLRRFDAAIVEPTAFTALERAQLLARRKKDRSSGNTPRPILIAYLSCSEALPFDPILRQALPDDYFRLNGQPVRIPGSNAFVMDLRQAHWRQLLGESMRRLIADGYDGVFLDTLAIGEDPKYAGAVGEGFLAAAGTLVRDLREQHPDAVLVQNWCIHYLKERTAAHLDGICWENFQPALVDSDAWTRNRFAELQELRRSGLAVLTLYELKANEITDLNFQGRFYRTSRDARFVPYCALPGYTAGVNLRPLQAGL